MSSPDSVELLYDGCLERFQWPGAGVDVRKGERVRVSLGVARRLARHWPGEFRDLKGGDVRADKLGQPDPEEAIEGMTKDDMVEALVKLGAGEVKDYRSKKKAEVRDLLLEAMSAPAE